MLFKWSVNELESCKTKKSIISYEITEIYQVIMNINNVEKLLSKIQYYGNICSYKKIEEFKKEFFIGFKKGINKVDTIRDKLKEQYQNESECSFIGRKMDFHKVGMIVDEIIYNFEETEENKRTMEELEKQNSQRINNLSGLFGSQNDYNVAQRYIGGSTRRITILDNNS